ncbi:PREDICTED: deoxyribose-phosphate aldolase [Nicrophorus vespilloides]|uniref:deoxyribose-phosphate aldolase n=1 Tax=Nicrophorus vespilloides TaxID=110193 RepID=A0ABM1NCR4_NICVS|nr:PREDICTED: deoxyribose-phosphate aldolase [Nicrophorus vespilloides]
MAGLNPGIEKFDWSLIKDVNINLNAVKENVSNLVASKCLSSYHRAAWLLKAVTCIDLTTLGGDDTQSNVARLCFKAAHPISADLLKTYDLDYSVIHTAAVCVYPSRVIDAYNTLKKMKMISKINIASVATGFPSGQYCLKSRLEEIRYAIQEGANEIDIVIDRSLVLTGQWLTLFNEIKKMKDVCGEIHMKAILATGELGNLTNVYMASMVAMMAGADFIKTSTGKESINATLPFGMVMASAISKYHVKYGFKVGLKPAGGIRTSADAINWLIMIKELLGDEWLSPKLFRFGASGLLTDIEHALFEYATGLKAVPLNFTMG